jgi:hypothetical protein
MASQADHGRGFAHSAFLIDACPGSHNERGGYSRWLFQSTFLLTTATCKPLTRIRSGIGFQQSGHIEDDCNITIAGNRGPCHTG